MKKLRSSVALAVAAGVLAIAAPASAQEEAGFAQACFVQIEPPADVNVIVSDDPIIIGTDGPDYICAGPSNNRISALAGDDIVLGGGGDDVIFGRSGKDSLYGQDGNDTLRGHIGTDKLDGGAGDGRLTEIGKPLRRLCPKGAGAPWQQLARPERDASGLGRHRPVLHAL